MQAVSTGFFVGNKTSKDRKRRRKTGNGTKEAVREDKRSELKRYSRAKQTEIEAAIEPERNANGNYTGTEYNRNKLYLNANMWQLLANAGKENSSPLCRTENAETCTRHAKIRPLVMKTPPNRAYASEKETPEKGEERTKLG